MPTRRLPLKAKQKHDSAHDKSTPAEKHQAEQPTAVDARSGKDRRKNDRRHREVPVVVERRQMERRTKVSRRRQIDPTTCERDYTPDEIEFMAALDDYKRRSGRMFPTCSEVLEVLKGLGYQKGTVSPVAAVDDTGAEMTPVASVV
jgi:hypothetical protein